MTRQLLMGGLGTQAGGGVTRYVPIDSGWGSTPESIPGTVSAQVPTNGKLSELRIVRTATPGSTSIIYNFDASGNVGGLITLESGDISGTSTTSLAVTAGQGLTIRRSTSGTPTGALEHWSAKWTPDIADETILFANGGTDDLGTGTEYASFGGASNSFTSVEFDHEIVIPTAGTFKKMYGRLAGIVGDGKSRTFTFVKNSSDTSLAFTIANLDATGNDTSNTVSVVAGDSVVLKCTSSGSPDPQAIRAGIVFVPTTSDLFIVASGNRTGYNTTSDRYGFPSHGLRDWQVTEADRRILSFPSFDIVTFKNMYVLLSGSASPSAGRKITLTLRKDGSDTALALTMSGSTTSGNVTADVEMSDDSLWGIEAQPTTQFGQGPNQRRSQISFAVEMNSDATVRFNGGTIPGGNIAG